ncbi:MAG: hypothetical protein AAF202_02395 [Pseudomonadota bacterium]
MKQDNWFKLLIVVGLLVVSASLYLSVRYGVAPRAIPLIKPTEVESIQAAGVLAYRRMRQDLRASSLLVTGSLPLIPNYEQFWQGFHLAANADNAKYVEVFYSLGLKLFPEAGLVETQETQDLYFKDLDSLRKQGRSLIYTHSLLSSHFVQEGLSQQLEQSKTKAMVITLHPFLVTREQVKAKNNKCEAMQESASVIYKLDCIAEKVSRLHFKKKLDPSKNYVALFRYGQQDYVAFYYQGR